MTDLVPGAAADGPVKGGAGSNPAGAGLEADRSVVPPPAAAHPSWRWPLVLAVACCAAACARWWPHVRDELFVIVGNRDEAGGWYGWWSGNAGGLQIFEWAALGCLLYRHHNCEVHACWRIKRHTTAAGHVVCRAHSPDGAPTHEDVIAAHRAALREAAP